MSNTIMQTLNDAVQPARDIAVHADLPVASTLEPPATAPTAEEVAFYDQYPWVLNAFPTMREVLNHLAEQLSGLESSAKGWQQREVITNVFLLACSVTDTVDDYIVGNTYDLSKVSRAFPIARECVNAFNRFLAGAGRLREIRLSHLRAWNSAWRSAVTDFLQHTMIHEPAPSVLVHQCAKLSRFLPPKLPKSLWNARPKMPAFFRSRDFAPPDCVELGKKYAARFPDGDRPVVVLGLRTAGSFLAPLLCAYLRTRFPAVDWTTVRPKRRLALSERAALRRASRRRSRVLVIDESIHSGQTLVTAISLLRRMGFADEDLVVLNPAEPAFPNWKESSVFRSVPGIHTIALEPAERYKQRLLDSSSVNSLLSEYFRAGGFVNSSVVISVETEEKNSDWRKIPERVDVRLKRVFEVHVEDATGQNEIRRVLAKSVGWGWLGYHAFRAGRALQEHVPRILGLRDGVLYSEWLPQRGSAGTVLSDRELAISSVASYVAGRVKALKLPDNPTPSLTREGRNKGLEMLATTLSRAYSSRTAAAAKRFWIKKEVSESCRFSVLTDSKMAADEWLKVGSTLRKTDFEHHGQGKNELGMTDPAYDLADAIFQFGCSADEERRLLETYKVESGDNELEDRLFLNKLVVGLWAQNLATLGLENPHLVARRDVFHRQSVSAWNFLVSQTVRECGKLCRPARDVGWRAPLVVLDVDGVLDRMVFGFPSTTAAGIQALSLWASHGFMVALNTARTLREVKEYCGAYGLAGGVAEYGAVAWDRASDRQVALVDAESMRELEQAREVLRGIPGVFLNDDYQFSLRAFTYQNGRTMPLPRLMAENLLAGLKLNRLLVHHTGLDTAITAKEADKGRGLGVLLSITGIAAADVAAVGDSEPDLAMFRVAGRSFAPGNVSCRQEAQLLGCRIAKDSYQPGLLEIARTMIHPDGSVCRLCRAVESSWRANNTLFVSLLKAADKKPLSLFIQNILNPSLWKVFRK